MLQNIFDPFFRLFFVAVLATTLVTVVAVTLICFLFSSFELFFFLLLSTMIATFLELTYSDLQKSARLRHWRRLRQPAGRRQQEILVVHPTLGGRVPARVLPLPATVFVEIGIFLKV